MAMNYQNFASLGVNLNRQKYGPLDISGVFTSEADLRYYLTKGAYTEGVSEYWTNLVPYPYEGQVLATVIDGTVNVYVLALDADDNFTTQEIAGKIEVDGKTVKINAEGELELAGLKDIEPGKTYIPTLINGLLTWVEPDTSTAEGQAQEIEGLKARTKTLEDIINGKAAVGTEGDEDYQPAVEGLVDKVEANAEAIITEAEAREAAIAAALAEAKQYADENDADTAYDDTELTGRVEALETAVGDTTKGLVKDVAANTEAIANLETAYKDADVTTLASAKTYTDEEIAGIKLVVEQKEGIEHIVIKDKDGAEIASVNASKFVQDSFLDDVAYNNETGKVTFTWTMGDGSTKTDEIDIAHLVDTYTAGTGLTVENNEFAIDTSVVATVENLNKVKETAEAAQTAEEVATAINAKFNEANLAQYAKASEVDEALNSKVDQATYNADKDTFAAKADIEDNYYTKTDIDNKGFATADEVDATYEKIGTAYTKAEVDAKIGTPGAPAVKDEAGEIVTEAVAGTGVFQHTFSKDEVTALVADITGGESAAVVKAELAAYKTSNDARVKAIEDRVTTQDATIAAIEAQANKGVDDAAAVAENLATLASGTVKTNTDDILAIKNRLTPLETASSDHTARLLTAEGKISAIETTANNNNASIVAIQNTISTLTAEDVRLANLITALDTSKANAADVYTKSEADAAVQAAINAIPAINLDPYAKKTEVESAISSVNAAIATKADLTEVYTKEVANATFMTESKVDDRINALINAADPEGGKVIANIQNLVKYVEDNADDISTLVTNVNKNVEDISGINASIVALNNAVDAFVAPKESEEVSVAADGTLGVKSLNVNKLTQATGDTLVLNGGNSTQA